MYTIDDLRQALADESTDRFTRLNFADVKRAAGRRRHRTLLTGIAVLLAPIMAAGGAIALVPGEGGPSPSPDARTSVPFVPYRPNGTDNPWHADSSFPAPASSDYIETGVKFGETERLVLFYMDDDNGLDGGLVDAGGGLRRIGSTGKPDPGHFGWTVSEFDDRHGGIIDYGAFGGADPKIKVTAGGQTLDASTKPVPGHAGLSVWWVRRGGQIAGPTSSAHPAQADAVIKAYDAHGTVLGTAGPVQRVDTIVNVQDASAEVGDRIHTGITAAGGGELVLFFYGDGTTMLLVAGRVDDRGRLTTIKTLMGVHQPPYGSGGGIFYGGAFRLDVDGGQKVRVGIYEGQASRVELSGSGAAHQGSGAWSAYPNLHVAWATGLQGPVTGTAYDAGGKVIHRDSLEN
ncbi:hypothetical protein Dvina_35265 [Dactylosporangium vinaceum]|uniref:Uncharacterized protein n=1 Tax=Dactylosporangium vinaceum TaxID=53362 RepID=A0ABV5M424_9ACTN|nr:hypothetical protein [Dactylosporangium vinaceum]UAB93487.1 hypothetical protein Dvina_35265 [Dactylosporangium vinaceum]